MCKFNKIALSCQSHIKINILNYIIWTGYAIQCVSLFLSIQSNMLRLDCHGIYFLCPKKTVGSILLTSSCQVQWLPWIQSPLSWKPLMSSVTRMGPGFWARLNVDTAARELGKVKFEISQKTQKVGKKQQNQNFQKSAKNPILVLL